MFGVEPLLSEDEAAKLSENLQNFLYEEKITYVMITEKEVTHRTSVTAEGSSTVSETSLVQITCYLGDDGETPYIIHKYDPAEENWLEDDFLGSTLDEAQKVIENYKSNEISERETV